MARKDRAPNPPKRPQGPQRRSAPANPAVAGQRRKLIFLVFAGALALAVAVAAVILLTGGGSNDSRTALEDTGCTLKVAPGLVGEHTVVNLSATSNPKWNTNPPTSGPHNEQPAVYGSYEDPVPLAQSVHNLEHGAVVIHYGKTVPDSDVEQIRAFYTDDPNGMIVAPLPKLGNKIALSAWTTQREGDLKGQGFLALCPRFDEDAFSAFVDEHRFKGPERFPPESLTPGS